MQISTNIINGPKSNY